MSKKALLVLLALMVVSVTAIQAYADSGEGQEEPGGEVLLQDVSMASEDASAIVVTEGIDAGTEQADRQTVSGPVTTSTTIREAGIANESSENTVDRVGLYPFDIEYTEFSGKPVIIKHYKIPSQIDPVRLVEDDFEEDGWMFSKKDIIKGDTEVNTDSKIVYETVVINSDEKDDALIQSLQPVVSYSEGGYTGYLQLASMDTETLNERSVAYTYVKTQEFPNLDRNDTSYIPKTLDGSSLQGIEWTSSGGSTHGDLLVPSSFSAVAKYNATGWTTANDGYQTTALYMGEVSRSWEGDTVFSVIYQGRLIEDNSFPRWGYWAIGIGLLITSILLFLFWNIILEFVGRIRLNNKAARARRKGNSIVQEAADSSNII